MVKTTNIKEGSIRSQYNGFVIGILTVLYILLITKLGDILTDEYEEEERIEKYVMLIYFLSVMGLVVGYMWIKENSNGNYVVKKTLTLGGILMLMYMVISYWEYINDYSKLLLIIFTISFILYYCYR